MNTSRIREGVARSIVATLVLAAACAPTRMQQPSAPAVAASSFPPLPSGSSTESKTPPTPLADAGAQDSSNVQVVSNELQLDCAWPTNAADKNACVSLAYLVDDPNRPKTLHVRVVANLQIKDGVGALSASDAPPVAIHFDNPPSCSGNDLETIEGDLAGLEYATDAPLINLAMSADGPSFAIVHAKVIGPPASACSIIKPRSALKLPAAFDRGAVTRAVLAVKTNDCLPHTAHEAVHIKITFLPTGSVGNVDVDTQLSGGTQVEQCVKSRFLKVKVPAFGGGPITVGKSFVLEP